METITSRDYAKYLSAHDQAYGDALSIGRCADLLALLHGCTVRSTDRCYTYHVEPGCVRYSREPGEKLGQSTFDGLLGWACNIETLDDLLNELDADGDVERSLWVCGMSITG